MSGIGYLEWDSPILATNVFLDGRSYSENHVGLQCQPGPGVMLLGTHARTTILQRPYLGVTGAADRRKQEFNLQFQGVYEEDYFHAKRIANRGAAVVFCPFMWEQEVFDTPVTGQTRYLTRSVAWTLVTGVTSGTHPAIFILDGVVDAAAASLSGQTVSVLKTGTILEVRYMPAYNVAAVSLSESVPQSNGLTYSLGLSEVVTIP